MTMSQEATGIAGILGAFKLLCTCECRPSFHHIMPIVACLQDKYFISWRPLTHSAVLPTHWRQLPICVL